MKREFAVIGLGRFGGSICRELSEEGMDVLAIDIHEEKKLMNIKILLLMLLSRILQMKIR